jgi:hypothetical protein
MVQRTDSTESALLQPVPRRTLASAALALGAFAFTPRALASGPRLFVFVPTDEKPRNVERALQASMPGLTVTVFGKSTDFESELQAQRPEAVLALPPALHALGLPPVLQGLRGGSAEEDFVLLTIDGVAAPGALRGETVGLFGFMGRQETRKFCGRLLGTPEQRVKTVTKYADLLPMLQFNAARGVVLPRRSSAFLIASSKLNLVVNELPAGRVGLPSVAVLDRLVLPQVRSGLESLNVEARGYLAVDGWKS